MTHRRQSDCSEATLAHLRHLISLISLIHVDLPCKLLRRPSFQMNSEGTHISQHGRGFAFQV